MVNAVCKPHLLQVFFQSLEIGVVLVALVAGVERFKGLTHLKIVLAVLVCENVATLQSCFGEVVNKFLLI